MMPGTANRVADEQAFAQRALIVGAVGADCEQLATNTRNQHLVIADTAHQLAAVGKVGSRNAFGEIRACFLRLIGIGHG
jgi:hypothetical protein